jgi:GNAT superfamily N-acetyltransferase
MGGITIRRITGENQRQYIPAIVHVFRDDPVAPWSKPDECAAWVTRRAGRGFYIVGAYRGGAMVGYSEWIETFDRGRKLLYLGLMQVDCELRSKGIGGVMLADGAEYAKRIGAACLRTMPEDERSHKFYLKYGFIETDKAYACGCPAIEGPTQDSHPVAVTLDAVNTHEFVFGLGQFSGRHIYEIANHPPEGHEYLVKNAGVPGGYLQFRYRQGADKAEALYWSNEPVTGETVKAILAAGYGLGFGEIAFVFREKYKSLFAGCDAQQDGIELEREL